jgi:hypothetical protein
MVKYFKLFFKFLENTEKLKIIIEHELNKNGCENLNILYKILKNVENENIEGENIELETRKKSAILILSNIKIIVYAIGDIGTSLFNFVNWQQIFSDKQKSEAIKISKNYELLNISEIVPINVIKFLIENDFERNVYFDIANKISENATDIYFRLNKYKFVPPAKINSFSVITKYFPNLEYLTFDKIPLTIIDINKNIITFTFNKTDIKIFIGTNLILGSVILSDNMEDNYNVIEINKLLNNNKCKIDNAEYCNPIFGKIIYELILDVEVSKDRNIFSSLWLITKVSHKVLLF